LVDIANVNKTRQNSNFERGRRVFNPNFTLNDFSKNEIFPMGFSKFFPGKWEK
jgi:hypothetical protein